MIYETTNQSVNLYSLMMDVLKHLTEANFEVIIQHGLTPPQYFLLIMLQQNPNLTQKEIARELRVSKGNVSQMLKIMERDGLVVRKADGAAYRVMVTQKAIDKIEIIIPEHQRHIAEQISVLSEAEQEQLNHIMSKLAGLE